MAWMSDEAWEMVSDSRDKKITARSARSTRTHCGKRGAVKFPSDYKTRKELKAMNGEVETYRMNQPMSWEEFVKMPIDLQRKYIEYLRGKFNTPDQYIAEMMGKERATFVDHLFRLKMSTDKWMEGNPWDSEGFAAWRLGVEKPESNTAKDKKEETMGILDRPMTYAEFKKLSDEQKKEYIEYIRKRFDAPNSAIGNMFGVSGDQIGLLSRKLNVGYGRPPRGRRTWDEAGFNAWLNGESVTPVEETPVDISEETVCNEIVIEETPNEIPNLTEQEKEHLDRFVQDLRELSAEVTEGAKKKSEKTESTSETEVKCAVPEEGKMTFNGKADDILQTIKTLLNNTNVCLEVKWFVND